MNIFIEKIKEYYEFHKVKIVLYGTISLIFIVFLSCSYYIYKSNKKDTNNISAAIEPIIIEDNKENPVKYIFVDIKGFVVNPGVYELEEGKRVINAIEMAGGLKENSNTRFINLSKELKDGDVIVVYSNEEIENSKKENIIYVETPCVCEEVENTACFNEEQLSLDTDKTQEVKSTLININTSTSEELQALNGIGESKANAIIEYRETNGSYANIEDIKNVNGISDSLYDKIKDFITTE